MIDYYILGIIFVFTFFILWYLVQIPDEDDIFFKAGLIGGISWGLVYLMSIVLVDTEFSTFILISIMVSESLFLPKIIRTYPKKLGKLLLVVFLIFMGVSLLAGRGCYYGRQKDIKKANMNDSLQVLKDRYLSQFQFNIDSLGKKVKYSPNITLGLVTPKFIIYTNSEGSLSFNYNLTKRYNLDKVAFTLADLNTIIIIENHSEEIGKYNNQRTIAKVVVTDIYFISYPSKNTILKKSLTGQDPPHTIKTRRSVPEDVTGKAPTEDQIFEEISEVFN